jgi:hypothetical protein
MPLCDYLVLDARGAEVEAHRTCTWSIDDELGADVYRVDGGRLVQVRVVSVRERVDVTERVVLDGLVPVGPGDATAHAVADAARERANREERARDERRQSRARSIRGALDDYQLGADFAAAQRALLDRFVRYEEDRSGEMLRALLHLGCLYEADPGLEEALGTLVWACRRAAYDRGLPDGDVRACPIQGTVSLKGFRGLNAVQRKEAAGLVEELERIERGLLQDAEGQEWVDANLNATRLRSAARGVKRAAELLAAI